jgi:COP9 signalosome complex subunit 1
MMETEAPRFDLQAYISRYEGPTRLNRLLFISEYCPEYQATALRILVDDLKRPSSLNTLLYQRLNHMGVFQQLGDGVYFDNQWVNDVDTKCMQHQDRLESDLQTAKAKMIKESIRLCYNDFGDFLVQRGVYDEATKMYLRTREYSSNNRQVAEQGLKAIKACIDGKDFKSARQNLIRIDQVANEFKDLSERCKLLFGVIQLNEGDFESAATNFINVDPTFAQNFTDIASVEDIVLYGNLCALASFSRASLKGLIIDNIAFKGMTDIVPEVKGLAQFYCSGQYSQLFSAMEGIRGLLSIDMHLQQHADTLFTAIKERCIAQYIAPFSVVDMRKMAGCLQIEIPELAGVVARMITAGKVAAKIDMASCMIYRRKVNDHKALREKMLTLGHIQIRDLRIILLRLSMMQHSFSIDSESHGRQPTLFPRAHDDLEMVGSMIDLADEMGARDDMSAADM